jgi:hypothetical protein
MPRVGMSGAKPLLPEYAFMARTGELYFLIALFMLGLTRLCDLGFR